MSLIRTGTPLRDCEICGKPVLARPYQADSARACSPVCAHTLAAREHPELKSIADRERPS